ncbi:MAG: efflux RND transporter permease subunit [Alphaproteobacteria bacterium]
MHNFVAWWVKNAIAANLLMLIIIVMGFVGFNKLEREFVPTTDFNQINVSGVWQGASPNDIQEQIIFRIEEAIEGIDGVDYVEANAREGSASVSIITLVQSDFDRIYEEVKTRVDGINNLPPDAFRLQVRRASFEVDFIYMALYGGDLSRKELQRLSLDLRDEMAKLPSGNLTQMISKLDEEITIEISEDALRRYDLTFTQVSSAISSNSLNLSSGDVKTSAGRLQLRTRNLASTKEEFEELIVRQTANGGTVRVKDIATVIDGFEDLDFHSEYKGHEAMFLRVLSPEKSNVTDAGVAFRKYIKERNKTLPPGVVLEMWADGSEAFDAQMNLIGSNALMGLLLVLIILGLFLRPKVALWVTLGIITSFMGALAIAPYIGISFNIISTFAFLLVIGIIVDDAIVVGESIHFHVEHGVSGERGAIGGTRLVTKPVFFAVLTTMIAFLPWAFFSGPTSAFTAQITLVVIAALLFSLVEAFLILPAHLRHLKPLDQGKKNALIRFQEGMANSLLRFAETKFRPMVAFFVHNRYATMATFIGMFFISIVALQAGLAKVQMEPAIDGDMMQVTISFPEGTSFERSSQVQKQMEDAVKRMNVDAKERFNIDYELIPQPGSFVYNTRIQAFMGLAPPEKRDTVTSDMIETMFQEYLGDIPDAQRVQVNAGGGGSNQRGVFFGVASNNPADLSNALFDLKAQLETYGNTVRAWDNLESSAQEMRFELKPGAERLGIDLLTVSRQVREAFYGKEVMRVPRDGEDVRIVLRYPEAARDSIDSLENLRVRGANGVEVPLYQVASVSFAPGVSRVNRRDSKQVAYSGAVLKGGAEARQEIMNDMNDNFLPEWELRHPNAERLLVGEDKNNATFKEEAGLFLWLMLGSMYVLLAVAFKSYSQPLLILVAVPFAFVGMTFGNVVVGTPMGIMSAFGFFAAAGVAVNDNLVLLDYVNRLRAKGVGAYQAMVDACVARFRPILLTSVTTFMGVMPMLAEKSVQAQFMKPMVVALAFGVLFDFFLTLILVPAMYGIGVDISRTAKRIWTGVPQEPLGSRYDPDVALALEDMDVDMISEASPH